MRRLLRPTLAALLPLCLAAGVAGAAPLPPEPAARYIPPACWTATQDADGSVHDPCSVCHTTGKGANFVDDHDVVASYAFPQPALTNPWTGLFADHRAAQAAWTDAAIDAWVAQDNLAPLRDQVLPGHPFVVDAHHRFDDQGFDLAPDGRPTGWRAVRYAPFPGTFWPTNGSVGDLLLRLPAPLRTGPDGQPDRPRHRANLAVLEALLTARDVVLPGLDERALGVDLDLDGKLGPTDRVTYRWPPPPDGPRMRWVGSEAPAVAGLYPVGTELLHAVRYLQVQPDGSVQAAPHLRELRYAKKVQWRTYAELSWAAAYEAHEKAEDPDALRPISGTAAQGLLNDHGWRWSALIEAADGSLRPQTREELRYCMGCHGGALGATTDTTFALGRKLPGEAGWSGDLSMAFPDPHGEYAAYLRANGWADELRSNAEARDRFFDASGTPRPDAFHALATDARTLLWPSAERARALNKAAAVLAQLQAYETGRELLLAPPEHLHRRVDEAQPTGITPRSRALRP